MKIKRLFLFFVILSAFYQCNIPSVNPTTGKEYDFVLINIEEGDRSAIAHLLLQIDSMKPAAIAVNAMFEKEKDPAQDSALLNAFKSIKNDIMICWLGENKKPIYPIKKFTEHAAGIGVANFEYSDGLVTYFTPVFGKDDQAYESLPLTVVKMARPDFKQKFKKNKRLKINYTRTAEQFFSFNGSDLKNVDTAIIKDKIILLGYLGPKKEDKFFTPLRLLKDHPRNEPDSYGLIIIANQIRTLLEQ